MGTQRRAVRPSNACTLRGLIECSENTRYKERFKEAEQLARSIFSEGSSYIPMPYFTKHDVSHCEAVERHLDQIIWGGGKPGLHDFEPTPEEAMYLLSAAWLHDLGMMYGILDGESSYNPPDYEAADVLRDDHETRMVRYVHEVWHVDCRWEDDEKTWLTNICAFHRRRHNISSFEPVTVAGDGQKPVRLVVLAALLRLADACHEDQSRAPASLRALYVSLGMPREALNHWETANLIRGIEFDHTSKRIVLKGHCPPKHDYGLGQFDLAEVVDIVRQSLEDEFNSVQQVLLPYPNTYFGEVKQAIYRPFHLRLQKERRYLALWPYLLEKPRGSTEAAAALAQMLLFAVQQAEESHDLGSTWRNQVLAIMDETEKSRRGDFVIGNLCQGAKSQLHQLPNGARSAERLTQYLSSFLNRIREDCHQMAELALAEGLAGPEDVLVVHGYCANIAEFLKNIAARSKSRTTLYVVDWQEPIGKVLLGPSQNDRMIEFADGLGFEGTGFLHMATLAQVLDELKQSETPCKVLLGVHGVLRDNEKTEGFICKAGSRILASTAREFDAEVVVFAETTKLLVNGKSLKDVSGPDGLFSPKHIPGSFAKGVEIVHLTPELDFVPSRLVDHVVTEAGAFTPDTIPIQTESTESPEATGKKESNPA